MSENAPSLDLSVLRTGLALSLIAACATGPSGGILVKQHYRPEVLVAYGAEGAVPSGVQYFLVRFGNGLAFFERDADGSGTLFQNTWRDEAGDHFAVWANGGTAFEIFVPQDRAQPAYRFAYPLRLYTIDSRAKRPVPRIPIDAATKLTPRNGPPTAGAAS